MTHETVDRLIAIRNSRDFMKYNRESFSKLDKVITVVNGNAVLSGSIFVSTDVIYKFNVIKRILVLCNFIINCDSVNSKFSSFTKIEKESHGKLL